MKSRNHNKHLQFVVLRLLLALCVVAGCFSSIGGLHARVAHADAMDSNLLADPGFEQQSDGNSFSPPWVLESSGGGIAGLNINKVNNSEIHTGVNAAWIWTDSGSSALSQTVNVTVDTRYTFGVWVSGGWTTVNGRIGVRTENGTIIREEPLSAGSTYTQIKLPFNSGENSKIIVYVKFENQGAAPLIDDFSLYAVQNLLQDPGFENQLSESVSDPWSIEGTSGATGGINTDTDLHSGHKGVWIWTDTGSATLSQSVSGLEPNQHYTFSTWLSGGWTTVSGVIGVKDGNGDLLTEETVSAQAWGKRSIDFITGDVPNVKVYLSFTNQPAAPLVDDFSLELATGSRIAFDKVNYQIEAGSTAQAIVNEVDGNGNRIPLDGASFTIDNPQIASVTSDGLITGLKPGNAMLTAAYMGMETSAQISITQPALPPSPWLSEDLGTPSTVGKSRVAGDVYTLNGSGTLSPRMDSFHYTVQPLVKNGQLIARIDSAPAAGAAGLFIRENMSEEGASYTFIGSLNGEAMIAERSKANEETVFSAINEAPSAPYWVKLVRADAEIKSFISANGTDWTEAGVSRVGTGNEAMFIGMLVNSNDDKQDTAIFSHVDQETIVNASVNWSKSTSETGPLSFGLNAFKAFDPDTSGNAKYNENMKFMNPGLVRYHGWEVLRDKSDPRGWIDEANHTWDANKIKLALGNFEQTGEKVMNVPGFPSWMDVDGDGLLDQGQEDAYANFLAELVRIINVENHFSVKYWEITNERDDVYYVQQHNNQQTDRLNQLIEIYNKAAIKMKGVDPSIHTGGLAFARADLYEQVERYVEGTVHQTINPSVNTLDFLSYHFYASGDLNESDKQIYDRVINPDPSIGSAAKHTKDIYDIVNRISPDRHIPIWLDEYNISWGWYNDDTRMRDNKGAVFDALVMISAHNNGADATAGWNEKDGIYGKMGEDYTLRPSAYLYNLMNTYMIGNVVQSSSSNENEIVTFAVRNNVGQRSYMIVNRSDHTVRVGSDFHGWVPAQNELQQFRIDYSGYSENKVSFVEAGSMLVPSNSVTLLTLRDPYVETNGSNGGSNGGSTNGSSGGDPSNPMFTAEQKILVQNGINNLQKLLASQTLTSEQKQSKLEQEISLKLTAISTVTVSNEGHVTADQLNQAAWAYREAYSILSVFLQSFTGTNSASLVNLNVDASEIIGDEISFPADWVLQMKEIAPAGVKIHLKEGTVKLLPNQISPEQLQKSGQLKISFVTTEKQLGNHLLPTWTLRVKTENGQLVKWSSKSLLTFTVPYSLRPDVSMDSIVVYELGTNGTAREIPVKHVFDPLTHKLTIQTDPAASFAVSAIGPLNGFTDLQALSEESRGAIEKLTLLGVLKGQKENVFAPKKTVSRAEFAVMLARLLGLKADDSGNFSDIDEHSWYAESVAALQQAGLIRGNGQGKFDPGRAISRQEIAVVLAAALKFAGKSTSNGVGEDQNKIDYKDRDRIDAYAREAIHELSATGLFKGRSDGSFGPTSALSREEAALLLSRLDALLLQ